MGLNVGAKIRFSNDVNVWKSMPAGFVSAITTDDGCGMESLFGAICTVTDVIGDDMFMVAECKDDWAFNEMVIDEVLGVEKVCFISGRKDNLVEVKLNGMRVYINDDVLRSDAFLSAYKQCEHCGGYFDNDHINKADGKNVCRDCLLTFYVPCEVCGTWTLKEKAVVKGDMTMCKHCAATVKVKKCKICGKKTVLNSHGICKECDDEFSDDKTDEAHRFNYSFKPAPHFQKTASEVRKNGTAQYFGLEIELRQGDDSISQTAAAIAELRRVDIVPQIFYPKYDQCAGSGSEFVSHPMTLKAMFANARKIKEFYEIVKRYGLYDADGTGLHIHANKKYFGENDERDYSIAKMLVMMYKHWDRFFVPFSDRKSMNEMEEWAPCNQAGSYSRCGNNEYGKTKRVIDYAYDDDNRYRALNLQNSTTIEFRIFQSTLDIDMLFGAVEMVSLFTNWCMKHTIKQCEKIEKFSDIFPKTISSKPELLKRLSNTGTSNK
jgi:hypothetical protein